MIENTFKMQKLLCKETKSLTQKIRSIDGRKFWRNFTNLKSFKNLSDENSFLLVRRHSSAMSSKVIDVC